MARFIAIGECMVELSPTDQDQAYRLNFSGDTFNAAWYTRRCLPSETEVSYLTAVGSDSMSDRMVAFMEASGIGTSLIGRRRGRTVGLYIISLVNGERSFSYWRGQSAAKTLAQDLGNLPDDLGDGDVVYVSGITLAILDPEGRKALIDAMARAQETGAIVAFDPNIRPKLWEDPDEMQSAITDGARAATHILPSFDDEATAFGDATLSDTAKRYLVGRTACVVVKNGGATGLVATPDGQAELHPETVAQPVDTTAAGDAFNAGFLSALMQGKGVEAAATDGAALAARVVQERGALIASMA